MLSPSHIHTTLQNCGVRFYAGVPDSLLKHFCAYLTDHQDRETHVITANEGSAAALVTGYYLATGKLGLVYLQNSGQGNLVNPLLSLADPDVYSIPMILMVGWRGEPGVTDEPQHVKQGKVTLDLFDALDIPYFELPSTPEEAEKTIAKACMFAMEHKAPVALIIKKGTFESYSLKNKVLNPYEMTREQAVQIIAQNLGSKDVIVSTTGKTSRELFEYRQKNNEEQGKDFLTVGSMGHASKIAFGVALAQPDRHVVCLDGDGAAMMHMGSLAVIGTRKSANFTHVVLNNSAHDSVGGQPTVGFDIDFPSIAKACGYAIIHDVDQAEELTQVIQNLEKEKGPRFVEVRVQRGARENLGRPTTTPQENKQMFTQFLEQ